MPYRLPPSQLDADAEARELAAAQLLADRQRRRAALGVAAGVLALVGAVPFIASISPGKRRVACHKVEIRYENAPEIPGERWTSCAER